MKIGIGVGILIGAIVWIMVLPNTSVMAIGPGNTRGIVGSTDTYWNGLWTTIYNHTDINTTYWTTGVSFYNNLSYKGHIDIKELTIPWIAIRMENSINFTIYPHDDNNGTSNMHIKFVGPFNNGQFTGYTESNNQPNNPTILMADYDLDFDGDGQVEFSFTETIYLYGNGGPGNNGYIFIGIKVTKEPWYDRNGNGLEDAPQESYQHLMPDGTVKRVLDIRYVFFADPDVYDTQNNNFYFWNNGAWMQRQTEMAGSANICDASGRFAKFENINGTRQISMAQQNPSDAHNWSNWYAVAVHGNEYSQDPGIHYTNNENIANADGALWCDEGYHVWDYTGIWNHNFPPGAQGPGGWSGVKICDFQA